MAIGVERIDKAVAPARHVVMLLRVLYGIGHKEVAIDVLDAERREARRDARPSSRVKKGRRQGY